MTAAPARTAAAPLPAAQPALEPGRLLAKARRENFPVALRLLRRDSRRHLMAIYGFARLVDDVGDEAKGDRLALLDGLERDLHAAFAGEAQHPILVGLAPTIAALELPIEPFARLVQANRVDQFVTRYERFEDLRGYCALSANPVGELVLRVFDAHTPQRRELSDAICTALQLAEHWQDVGEDYARGRVYLPREDRLRFGCEERELGEPRASDRLRALLLFEVRRTRALLDAGIPLVGSLSGRARLAVAGFAAGGYAALDAIEARSGDVLSGAARPRRTRVVRHVVRLLRAARRCSA